MENTEKGFVAMALRRDLKQVLESMLSEKPPVDFKPKELMTLNDFFQTITAANIPDKMELVDLIKKPEFKVNHQGRLGAQH